MTVGRPRPDFFYRCFPDGIMNSEMLCTGEYWRVMDGRKSFPSGHSSFSFATMGFLSYYLMGKLKVFSDEGRGKSLRLILCFMPLIAAMLVGKIAHRCSLKANSLKLCNYPSNFTHNGLSPLERGCRCRIAYRSSDLLHVLPSVLSAGVIEEIKFMLRDAAVDEWRKQRGSD